MLASPGPAVYGFMLSPNQTPTRDMIFLKLLVGIREPGEDFVVNQYVIEAEAPTKNLEQKPFSSLTCPLNTRLTAYTRGSGLIHTRHPSKSPVVYTALFNIMGIWPAVYASLLVPAGRSENKVRKSIQKWAQHEGTRNKFKNKVRKRTQKWAQDEGKGFKGIHAIQLSNSHFALALLSPATLSSLPGPSLPGPLALGCLRCSHPLHFR
eukprot:scaffold262312_cov17-Tisochrysis_lutea.AAC.1